MDKDYLIQKIGYYRNVFTLMLPAVFIVGSGILWAFFEVTGTTQIIIISIGSLIELIILTGIVSLNKNIKRLISLLKGVK